MAKVHGKTLDEIDNPLERAVFEASYRSRRQRARRLLAALTLGAWHTIRGLLFLWPIWLTGLAVPTLADGPGIFPAIFFLVPGVAIALLILARGIRADYRRKVAGRLLERGVFTRMLRY
ncbi:MAG: hypothetical protein U9R74_14855 [Pseudomonadota bacterium]|nr:hypothetical protein [Pseudomonadota bacterium]